VGLQVVAHGHPLAQGQAHVVEAPEGQANPLGGGGKGQGKAQGLEPPRQPGRPQEEARFGPEALKEAGHLLHRRGQGLGGLQYALFPDLPQDAGPGLIPGVEGEDVGPGPFPKGPPSPPLLRREEGVALAPALPAEPRRHPDPLGKAQGLEVGLRLAEKSRGEDGLEAGLEGLKGRACEGGPLQEGQESPEALQEGLHGLDGPVEVGPVPPEEAVALAPLGRQSLPGQGVEGLHQVRPLQGLPHGLLAVEDRGGLGGEALGQHLPHHLQEVAVLPGHGPVDTPQAQIGLHILPAKGERMGQVQVPVGKEEAHPHGPPPSRSFRRA